MQRYVCTPGQGLLLSGNFCCPWDSKAWGWEKQKKGSLQLPYSFTFPVAALWQYVILLPCSFSGFFQSRKNKEPSFTLLWTLSFFSAFRNKRQIWWNNARNFFQNQCFALPLLYLMKSFFIRLQKTLFFKKTKQVLTNGVSWPKRSISLVSSGQHWQSRWVHLCGDPGFSMMIHHQSPTGWDLLGLFL